MYVSINVTQCCEYSTFIEHDLAKFVVSGLIGGAVHVSVPERTGLKHSELPQDLSVAFTVKKFYF